MVYGCGGLGGHVAIAVQSASEGRRMWIAPAYARGEGVCVCVCGAGAGAHFFFVAEELNETKRN